MPSLTVDAFVTVAIEVVLVEVGVTIQNMWLFMKRTIVTMRPSNPDSIIVPPWGRKKNPPYPP